MKKYLKVGLLIIATNKYINFLNELITSADRYFLNNYKVTYFIFSNQDIKLDTLREVVVTKVEHKEWPWMTLGRYDIFYNNADKLKNMDYLYYCDADMKFVSEVGDEVFSARVATQHPGFYGRRGTPETNPNSLACVHPSEYMEYFAGGFNGGTSYEYLKMAKQLSYNIKVDYSNNVIALWHDESHMNRYFIDNPPTKILSPSYCYAEDYNIPFEKKLLALNKNHKEMRIL